jgi:WD40 repeat protein
VGVNIKVKEGGIKMKYKINDAGNACCIQIEEVFNNELLLDFGFSNNDKFNRFLEQLRDFEENLGTKLLVPYYRTDHFNGLIKFAKCKKGIEIDEVYVPFIPQFDDSSDYNLLSKQIVFSFYLQSRYPLCKGSPVLYIAAVIGLLVVWYVSIRSSAIVQPVPVSAITPSVPTARVLMMTLTGRNATVMSVAYSPDGRRIVSGSDDRTISVWDVGE